MPEETNGHPADGLRGRLPSVVDSVMGMLEDTGKVDHVCTLSLPRREEVVEILSLLSRMLFPGYFSGEDLDRVNLRARLGETTEAAFDLLSAEIARCLLHAGGDSSDEARRNAARQARQQTFDLFSRFPALIQALDGDVGAAYLGDPAATGQDEIIMSYPGFRAILIYRIANEIHCRGVPLLARMMTEHAHSLTGIDIHPGASIGRNFFIDHGTGVVIGETTEIGANVKIYQGVTLGALSFPTDEDGNLRRGFKRHPTIEDEVIIYANTTILGAVTIGRGSVIGGNVFLTDSVDAGSKVTRDGPRPKVRQWRDNSP